MENIVGFWETPTQYRMYNARTAATRIIFIPQAGEMSPAEIEDAVGLGRERFIEELGGMGDHKTMPLSQQHEFGPHLRAIEASKRRRRETGNRRYH